MVSRKLPLVLSLAAISLLGLVPSARVPTTACSTSTYMIGPLQITPGQNRIAYREILPNEKPKVTAGSPPSGRTWFTPTARCRQPTR